jgi:hypothetical protein
MKREAGRYILQPTKQHIYNCCNTGQEHTYRRGTHGVLQEFHYTVKDFGPGQGRNRPSSLTVGRDCQCGLLSRPTEEAVCQATYRDIGESYVCSSKSSTGHTAI